VWIPIALAPVSNVFFPSGVALAERTLYLASVGACLALGALAERVARNRPTVVIAAAAALIALGAARTWTRTPVWRSDKSYTIALLRDHPESYRAHLVAGRVLSAQKQFASAAEHLEMAARLFPRDAAGAYEAAIVAIRLGRIAHADSLLRVARRSAPPEPAILLAHADVQYAMGDDAGAVRTAREALAIAPDSVRALVTIAVAARRAGNLAMAGAAMRDAVMISPERWDFRAGYADLLLARGDSSAARAQADSAVALSHGNPAAIALRVRLGELTAPHSSN
jgi:Flp pilus assembly protein TadD